MALDRLSIRGVSAVPPYGNATPGSCGTVTASVVTSTCSFEVVDSGMRNVPSSTSADEWISVREKTLFCTETL